MFESRRVHLFTDCAQAKYQSVITIVRIAQMVAHFYDTEEVVGSSPAASTGHVLRKQGRDSSRAAPDGFESRHRGEITLFKPDTGQWPRTGFSHGRSSVVATCLTVPAMPG